MKSQNKYLLIKISPKLKGGLVEGNSKFEEKFSFRYKYGFDSENKVRDEDLLKKMKWNSLEVRSACDPEYLACDSFNLIYNPFIIDNSSHYVQAEFIPNELNQNIIEGFDVYLFVGDEKFIFFISNLKVYSFVISLVSFIIFLIRMKKIKEKNRVIEQNMIINLSCLVLLFNDPFYALVLYKPSITG